MVSYFFSFLHQPSFSIICAMLLPRRSCIKCSRKLQIIKQKLARTSLKRCINRRRSLQSFSSHNSISSKVSTWMFQREILRIQSYFECCTWPQNGNFAKEYLQASAIDGTGHFLQVAVFSSEKQCQNLEISILSFKSRQSTCSHPHQENLAN